MKKIQIPLSEKLSIFVEKGIDDFSKEIIVYIGTKEGRWNQDIVSISPEYDLLKNKISWREDKVNGELLGNKLPGFLLQPLPLEPSNRRF